MFSIQPLPYKYSDLEPYLSRENLEVHYSQNYRKYVDKLNELVKKNLQLQGLNLEQIIRYAMANSMEDLFNNAAQVYNHNIYWKSLISTSDYSTTGSFLKSRLPYDYEEKFVKIGMNHFGDGWLWIVQNGDSIGFITTPSAFPMFGNTHINKVLANVDLFEHAFVYTYQSDKEKYLRNTVKHLLNWNFVLHNYLN